MTSQEEKWLASAANPAGSESVTIGPDGGKLPENAPSAQETELAPRFARVRPLARHLNLSVPTIYRLLGDKRLRARKFGTALLIDMKSVEEFVASLPVAEIKPGDVGAPGSRLARRSEDRQAA